jgi:hypothetical protein
VLPQLLHRYSARLPTEETNAKQRKSKQKQSNELRIHLLARNPLASQEKPKKKKKKKKKKKSPTASAFLHFG